MRRRVPNLSRSRAKVSEYNIKNDSMKSIKKFYGWGERQLEQGVRAGLEKAPQSEIKERYNEAYNKKKEV